MAYETNELSNQDSQPVELYAFAFGVNAYYYTSSEDDQEYLSQTYIATPISGGEIPQGNTARSQNLTITCPTDNAFVEAFNSALPGQIVTVTIRRFQREDPSDVITVYKGSVLSVNLTEDLRQAEILTRPLEGVLNRRGPKETYQTLCNNVLYRDGCYVPREDFSVTGSVTAESGRTLTIAAASAQADGWYTGGDLITPGGTYRRLILSHVGDQITVLFQFPFSLVGEDVTISAGCAHDINTCDTKFSNKANFRGHAYVPDRNIFALGLL